MGVSKIGLAKYSEDKRLIRQARDEKQLVLFVGSGASVDAGMPLWKDAIKVIADRLGIADNLDYLKVPQYYYNSRGKKEYTQLMREVFHDKEELAPQPLHDRIIKFNTDTIITTNYDHLIEQAAEKNREFIRVISKDTDLPYRKSGKELIKMHGDFENDNFVLKEDDYLHYHKNFKLIENYVKSIIGVKTILFIGYSLNDPDVKQILSWVGEILDNDIQHAYLIKADGEYDEYEYEYFRHLGVNLIYSTVLLEHSKEITANLLETLDFILSDETQDQSLIGMLYNELRPFEKMDFTYKKYIERTFNKKEIEKYKVRISEDGYLFCSGKEENSESLALIDAFLKISPGEKRTKTDRRLEVLYDVFFRSSLKGVMTKQGKKEDTLLFVPNSDLDKAIYNFDYNKLKEIKEKNASMLSSDSAELYLQQAAISVLLYDYVTAYTCLNNAIAILYRKKDHAKYFIALFSKNNIGKIIINDPYVNVDDSFRNKVQLELNALDLDKTLATIPDLGNEHNLFLKDLLGFKFSSELFYSAYKASNKAKKEATQTYMIYSGVPAYQELRSRVFDYYQYCTRNYIMVDRFRENNEIYDIFARSLIASLAAPDKGNNDEVNSWFYSSNIHVEEINADDIHLLLRYVDKAVLLNLFSEYDLQRINLSADAKEYIATLVDTVPTILTNSSKWNKGPFERLLVVLSRIELDENSALKILTSLSTINEPGFFHWFKDSIAPFCQAVSNQDIHSSDRICAISSELLSKLFGFIIADTNYSQILWNEVASLINCCYKGDNPYSDLKTISDLLEAKQYRLIVNIYLALSEEAKTHIKEYFSTKLKEKELSEPSMYAKMVIKDIRTPDQSIEKKCYKVFEDDIKKAESGVQEISFENPLSLFVNLYLNDLIIDKDTFRSIVLRTDDNNAKWLIDPENYDYTNFQIKWLTFCSTELLNTMSANESISQQILKRFSQDYHEGKLESRETKVVIDNFIVRQDKT